MGVVTPASKNPRWTEEEDKILRDYVAAKKESGEVAANAKLTGTISFWKKAVEENIIKGRTATAIMGHWEVIMARDRQRRNRSDSEEESSDSDSDDSYYDEYEYDMSVLAQRKVDSISFMIIAASCAIMAICMILIVFKLFEFSSAFENTQPLTDKSPEL